MEHEYSTPDLSLAAYLYTCGFSVTVEKNGFPFRFIVSIPTEKDSAELQERLREWQTGKASGNIPNYYSAYKVLQRQVVKNGD